MGAYRDDYVAYGMPVTIEGDYGHVAELVEQTQVKGGPVVLMMAGAYDRSRIFLVVRSTWKTLKPGEVFTVQPYQGTDGDYPDWDWELTKAAEEYGLEVLNTPAWMFVPDES